MEITVDQVLSELEIFIQNLRENGENDLRIILHTLKRIKEDNNQILLINQDA